MVGYSLGKYVPCRQVARREIFRHLARVKLVLQSNLDGVLGQGDAAERECVGCTPAIPPIRKYVLVRSNWSGEAKAMTVDGSVDLGLAGGDLAYRVILHAVDVGEQHREPGVEMFTARISPRPLDGILAYQMAASGSNYKSKSGKQEEADNGAAHSKLHTRGRTNLLHPPTGCYPFLGDTKQAMGSPIGSPIGMRPPWRRKGDGLATDHADDDNLGRDLLSMATDKLTQVEQQPGRSAGTKPATSQQPTTRSA